MEIVLMCCTSSASTGTVRALKLSSWEAVGKGSHMCAIFGCPTWLCKNGPWFPSEEIKSPMGSTLGWSLCGNFFLICTLKICSFVLHYKVPGQHQGYLYLSSEEGYRTHYCCLRGVCFAICSAIAARRDSLTMALTHAAESDLIWALLHVSKALFHPVLHYIAFPLVNPIPRCKGQKCWVLSWIS